MWVEGGHALQGPQRPQGSQGPQGDLDDSALCRAVATSQGKMKQVGLRWEFGPQGASQRQRLLRDGIAWAGGK